MHSSMKGILYIDLATLCIDLSVVHVDSNLHLPLNVLTVYNSGLKQFVNGGLTLLICFDFDLN